MIIGAYLADPDGDSAAGESYVVFGGEYGVRGWTGAGDSLDLETFTPTNGFTIKGIDEDDYSGSSVSSAGDVNGDGFDDMIIGAYGANPDGVYRAGESYVVFGGSSLGEDINLDSLDGSNGFRLDGVNREDYTGCSADRKSVV